MRKPNPSGRTPLLGEGGKPIVTVTPPEAAANPAVQELAELAAASLRPTPKAARPPVPYHHGNRDWETLNRIGMARREGNCAVPSWQLLLPHGCMGCLAPTGIPPLEAGDARLRLEGRGWVFRGGMWLCAACAGEGV